MEIPPFFTFFTSLMIIFPSIFLESSADAVYSLVLGQSLTYPETLTSPGGTFELGFFSPENSSNYYLAIRYSKILVDNLVWIANRDWPIPTPSASLSIYPDGNMVIKDGKKLYQVTDNSATNNTLVKLLDSGNLLLTRRGIDEVFWQSFDYPTATLLLGMKLGYSYSLVSWTSSEDPTPGDFSLTIDSSGLVIKQGDTIYWEGSLSEWNFTWSANGFWTYHDFKDSTTCKIVLDVYGQLKQQCWSGEESTWYSVQKRCGFRSCGSFSLCDENATTPSPCSCLDGFQPHSPDKWKKGETSEGCVRKTSLQCNNGTDQLFRDGQVLNVRFPSNPMNLHVSAAECRSAYLRNCSYIAYGFYNKCLVWEHDLFDVQPIPFGDPSQVLYYKIAASEFVTQGPSARTRQGMRGWQKQALILVGIVLGLLPMLTLGLFIYSRSKRNRFKKGEDLLLFDIGMSLKPASVESTEQDKVGEDRKGEIKLPLFSFSSVSAATDNFSAANKLGEGGFGPVYKGKLLRGEEVAVKRLSRRSGQGWEELENEALLIAKLQHKNLVRLLGCCTERDEKILIYEYMPNKSLDFFLFDPSKRRILDWETRARIVEGVAQGLLYLHQYSRLRIIHRDLKASNILLDRDMNPKISDFGLARIFGGNESEANTNRIVGTYGYMSPEYALEGLFSIKSDVFSFGVLLLEIVSGKKNTGLYQTASLNLLGYAWDMWTSERLLDLMDPVLELGHSSTHLPLRYVHIGLLCVQDSAADRPTMSDVVSMLSNDSVVLPYPKEPAFSNVRGTIAQRLPMNSPKSLSVNTVTVSTVQAR